MKAPTLLLFKSGYGGWRFRPTAADPGRGAVIEMRPLTAVDERLKYMQGRMPDSDVRWGWLQQAREPGDPYELPYERVRGYEAAVNEERQLLGLGRVGFGYPSLGDE